MRKETKYFIINYTTSDINYIDNICNYLDKEIIKIIDFFALNEYSEKIEITLFNDVNELYRLHDKFFKTIEKYGYVPKWVCGFSKDAKVYTLSLNELIKTSNHEKSTLEELKQLILHESIHSIHYKKNKQTLYVRYLSEALATNLSHQYDNEDVRFDATKDEILKGNCYYYNYNAIFIYLLEKYGKEYILKLITNLDFLNKETPKICDEVIEFYKENYTNKNKL